MGSRGGALVVVRAARILVMDPDVAHLARISDQLRASGYRVASVERPESVLPMAGLFRPEALVCDVLPPSMAGLEQGRLLRARSEAPVVVLGLSSEAGLGPTCIGELGADDFLPKPVDGEELVARLQARLRTRLERDALLRSVRDRGMRAVNDPLTGLYNRRFLIELLGQELRRGERFGTAFSLVIAELADFRRWCAQHGQRRSDALQRTVGEWFGATLRACDVAARVGQGRFAALLPNTDDQGARVVRERLLRALNRRSHPLGSRLVNVEAGVGVASFPDASPRDPERFFERACADLRQAGRFARQPPGGVRRQGASRGGCAGEEGRWTATLRCWW